MYILYAFFHLSKIPKPEAIVEEYASFNLRFTYYPTEKELIDDLNSLTVEHIHKFVDRQTTDFKVEKIFTLDDETKICSFKVTPHYSDTISTYLLIYFNCITHLNQIQQKVQ